MFEFKFPDVGEGITEGEIVNWKVNVGDIVKVDQVLAEVETAKAVVEIPSPKEGKIVTLHGKVGDTVNVGSVLVTIDDGTGGSAPEERPKKTAEPSQEDNSPEHILQQQAQANATSASPQTEPKQTSEPNKKKDMGTVMGVLPEYEEEVHEDHHFILKSGEKIASLADLAKKLSALDQETFDHHVSDVKNDFASWIKDVMHNDALAQHVQEAKTREELLKLLAPPKQDHIKALPRTRKYAQEKGIDLSTITPTGAHGEIRFEDIQHSAPAKISPGRATIKKREYDMYGYTETAQIKGIRKRIADHMTESLTKTAQLTHFDEADVTDIIHIRQTQKNMSPEVKLTLLPYIIKCLIGALKKHPFLNAHSHEDMLSIKKYFNIGIAVDTPDGLLVPVIKIAERKSLVELAKEIKRLAEGAREKRLDLGDLRDSTFSISNVGSIGGIYSTPIINYPETAVLLLGRTQEKPVVRDGQIVIRSMLPLSVTYDHRVVDGAEAARFTNDLKWYLENPGALFKID